MSHRPNGPIVAAFLALLTTFVAFPPLHAEQQATKVLGTIQSISGRTITVLSDTGTSSSAAVEEETKFLQIEPGKTDLKEAAPISFAELRAGDRVLVRGALAEDGKTI